MPEPFLNRVSLRTILLISGIILLFTLLLFTLFLLLANNTEKKTTTEKDDMLPSRQFSITDFYLEEELSSFFKQKTYPIRDNSEGWTKEEVDNFFIPVDKILHEYFEKKNDNYSKEIFNSVD